MAHGLKFKAKSLDDFARHFEEIADRMEAFARTYEHPQNIKTLMMNAETWHQAAALLRQASIDPTVD